MWSRRDVAHVFEVDPAALLDEIILTGSIDIPKDDFDFYPSPFYVVERLLAIADLQDDDLVLEPSAGRGAIAIACLESSLCKVDCIEVQQSNCDFLQAYFVGTVRCADFLQVEADPLRKYDKIIMNPPYFLAAGGLLVSVMSAGVMFRQDKETEAFRDFVFSAGGRFEDLPEKSFKESGTNVNTVIVVIPG